MDTRATRIASVMQGDPSGSTHARLSWYDFFLSRRGSVAAIAREVTDVLTEKGYKVLVQDYDIPLGASWATGRKFGVHFRDRQARRDRVSLDECYRWADIPR